LRRLLDSRNAPRRRPGRDLDPRLLARAVAHGPLRAGRGRAPPHVDHVRGRAARGRARSRRLTRVPLVLTGSTLTLDDLVAVARGTRQVALAPEALERMRRARAVATSALDQAAPVYWVSTGGGVRKRASV